LLTTVLEAGGKRGPEQAGSGNHLAEAARATAEQHQTAHAAVTTRPGLHAAAVQHELAHGYDMVFVGLDRPIDPVSRRFEQRLQDLVNAFDRPAAIAINGAGAAGPGDVPL